MTDKTLKDSKKKCPPDRAVRIDPLGIGKGEGHGWELGRAHEVGKRGEDRLTKEDMGSSGVGKDGGRGDRTQQGSMVTVVIVEIVRFQRGEGVGVRETRDR